MSKDINALIRDFEQLTDLSNGALAIPPKNKEELKIQKEAMKEYLQKRKD